MSELNPGQRAAIIEDSRTFAIRGRLEHMVVLHALEHTSANIGLARRLGAYIQKFDDRYGTPTDDDEGWKSERGGRINSIDRLQTFFPSHSAVRIRETIVSSLREYLISLQTKLDDSILGEEYAVTAVLERYTPPHPDLD